MNKVNRFFLFCSGANQSFLKRSPTENNKYVGIGATVLFTGLFAAIAAIYALFLISDSILLASIIGLLWGLMIFNLDRLIVSSIKKTASSKTNLLSISPRLVLAIFISLVIAKPLELKIFEKEINEELIQMSSNKVQEQTEKIDSLYSTKQATFQGHITSLKAELVEKAHIRNEMARIAQREADGTGGSQQRNLGPIYTLKKIDADNIQTEYQALEKNYSKLIQQHLSEISKLEKDKKAKIATIHKPTADGIAARMIALDNLANQNTIIHTAQLFIVLLFIIVETTPIFIKLMLDKGPYERITKSFEKTLNKRYKSNYKQKDPLKEGL